MESIFIRTLIIVSFSILFLGKANGQNSLSFNFENQSELEDFTWLHDKENWPNMVKDVYIEKGILTIIPWTSGWYADYMAPYLFTEVTGDFLVESKVFAGGITNEKSTSEWSLGGVMVREPLKFTSRDWKPNNQNWVFFTTGVANNIDQPVFETKTTIDSKSFLRLHPNNREWVEMRITRRGSVFKLLYKYENDSEWTLIEEFLRPDLPKKLQVGLVAYTDFYSAERELMRDLKKYNSTVVKYGKPDLKFEIDYFRIKQ